MPPSPRRRGAPKGNLNALKHGFYTRRLKKHDLTGVEATNNKDLVEEIALIRVFTRCLLESIEPDLDSFELAAILRALCLASATITRLVKTQCLLASSHSSVHDDISQAIQEVNAILRGHKTASENSSQPSTPSFTPDS
jgi:hypothetical protein